MQSNNSKWILYNLVICFAIYWLSNLILWYPWSINESLGQVLMLTVNPVLWGFASYSCIVRYPKSNIIVGVFLTSFIFISEAILSDLIFFVIIRNAKDKLMHITTLYAWIFVACVPLTVYVLLKKIILRNKKQLLATDFWKPLIIGLCSFLIITIIIILNIKFN
ncbi:glucan phosphoethanolaminetransferase (alkaline phosphatase superfamily) [Pedobacter sp. UYP30]